MEKTNQTVPEKDEAFEDLKAKLPMDPDDEKKEEKPEPPAPKPEEKEKKDEEDDQNSKSDEDDDEEEKEAKKKPNRPEKYIPIKQYTEEKDKWKGTVEEKDKRIAELEKMAQTPDNSKKFEDAVKKYAAKHDVDEETARAEVERVRDIMDFTSPPEKKEEKKPDTPTLSTEQQKRIDDANQIMAEKAFNDEYVSTAIPQLKEVFPKATPEQIESVKAEIEKLACTQKYLDKSLDYIVFKEQEALSEFFEGERKGPEPSRPPQKGKPTFTPADFANGKTSFEELSKLSSEERNNIVKNFDGKTWDKYMHWSAMNEELELD